MTNEEALKYLRDRYEKHLFNTEENPAIAKAMEALEEMLPKKPNATRHNICIVYRCPICDKLLTTYYPGMNVFICDRTKFCDDCGQAIDWSDE